MPTEIRLEPIPLTQILTDIFQKEGPDIGDIGLYFYPADTVNRLVQPLCLLNKPLNGLVLGILFFFLGRDQQFML